MRARRRWTLEGDRAVHVARDRHGVPHVRATTEADLYRGLGHCHGTDRALQLLLVRILGSGRAAELLDPGDETARLDRFFRRLDLRAGAEQEVARLGAAERALTEAYCDGLNRALARRVPWELRLVRYRPEPWTVADCVLTARVIAYVGLAQSQGEGERLLVELVQAGVRRDLLDELFPGALGGLDEDLLRQVRLGEPVVPEAVRWNPALPHAVASNNWAIAPARTATGGALLANDPHLEVDRLPAVWYEIAARLGERWCAGATMPGLPGILLGRTADLAWGATYSFMDTTDSWVEECRDGRCRRVVDGEERWVEPRRRTEVIRRRRGAAETVTFHESEHGVLDGDPAEPGFVLATRWSGGAGTGARTLAASFGMLHARTVAEGMELLGQVESAFNWIFADREGSIGFQMSGLMPERAEGWNGLTPRPGWEPAYDWRGFVPAAELPRALDPQAGFVVTANDDLNHLSRRDPINLPMSPYRAERIAAALGERTDWTVAASERLQMDDYSPHAEQFMAVLEPLLPQVPAAAELRGWDRRYDPGSRGATLFEAFYRALLDEVFGAALGPEVLSHLAGETAILADFHWNFDRVLLDPGSAWFGSGGQEEAFARAAGRALAGPAEPWGERQSFTMRHLVLGGRLPRALGFDRGPFPLRGGRATVHQGQVYRSGGRETSFAPSYRLVTDLSTDALHTCLAGGPSDRRFSRWYASGVRDWLAGRFKTVGPG